MTASASDHGVWIGLRRSISPAALRRMTATTIAPNSRRSTSERRQTRKARTRTPSNINAPRASNEVLEYPQLPEWAFANARSPLACGFLTADPEQTDYTAWRQAGGYGTPSAHGPPSSKPTGGRIVPVVASRGSLPRLAARGFGQRPLDNRTPASLPEPFTSVRRDRAPTNPSGRPIENRPDAYLYPDGPGPSGNAARHCDVGLRAAATALACWTDRPFPSFHAEIPHAAASWPRDGSSTWKER